MLVFVPVTPEALARWRAEGDHAPATAHAVTDGLRAAFGFTAADEEEAEHTALHVAGLAGLLRDAVRLVAVAEVAARPVPGDEWGRVQVPVVPWAALSAVFTESEPAAAAALAERSPGLDLAAAWDDPQVAEFLAAHQLLWHAPSEAALIA